ncbi:MAG: RluA family pseudouridine synthase [Spirochaetaceae bacterium]|jgi:23S rRNA pseudouridine955/2504/2580 synthase|nr:RluA family pseudouridine synthase [Spirochaetaceae bacterium]
MSIELAAGPDDDGRRLDRFLRKALPAFPLSLLHRLIRTGRVLVDGKRGAAAESVRSGVVIVVRGAEEKGAVRPDAVREVRAPVFDLSPLWESADLLALNKPAGIAVHGPASLEDLARSYLAGKRPPSSSFRPGPLHRLDRPTTGVIVFSASLKGARFFSRLLQTRRIGKKYLAIVEGVMAEAEVWEENLIHEKEPRKSRVSNGPFPGTADGRRGEKPAVTRAFPLVSGADRTLLLVETGTGRTHQIRAQAAFHGRPLMGDRKYGGIFHAEGLFLHAAALEFPDFTAEERFLCPEAAALLAGKTLAAPVPEAFLTQCGRFFRDYAIETCQFFPASRIIKDNGPL